MKADAAEWMAGYANAYANIGSDPTKPIYSNEDMEKLVKHAIRFTLERTTKCGHWQSWTW
jgi:hypothetical protein